MSGEVGIEDDSRSVEQGARASQHGRSVACVFQLRPEDAVDPRRARAKSWICSAGLLALVELCGQNIPGR